MEQDKLNKMFEFMLKEYEMLYSKFEMHYNAVEKTIALYFIVIGAIISANSFFIKGNSTFSIFNLSEFQIVCCLFIFIVGTVVSLKVIEHRLLIITYVKNLNQNRKWFNDKIANNEIGRYSLFETSYKSPKYYKKYRHFYWEVIGLSTINSSFLALFIVNIFKIFTFESTYFKQINWFWFFVILTIGVFLFLNYYKKRGLNEENKLENKGLI